MANATAYATFEVTDFYTDLRLNMIETAALLILLHHIAGGADSLRTVYDRISDAITSEIGHQDMLFDPLPGFQEMIDSARAYDVEPDQPGISFDPIDLGAVNAQLREYMQEFAQTPLED